MNVDAIKAALQAEPDPGIPITALFALARAHALQERQTAAQVRAGAEQEQRRQALVNMRQQGGAQLAQMLAGMGVPGAAMASMTGVTPALLRAGARGGHVY
jgi:hypothetical protein